MSLPCAVIVMAKAPCAGFAKTRLIPALGASGAAALAERMLMHAVAQAALAGLAAVDVCCTPDASHPAFAQAQAQARRLSLAAVTLSAQGEGDLGERMQRAFDRWLPQADAVLMVGTDIPSLGLTTLQAAAHALQSTDVVLVPAHDGGYALIGMRSRRPALFSGIPWSTSAVLARTREKLLAEGLLHVELPPVHDIDEPADLVHLPAGWLP